MNGTPEVHAVRYLNGDVRNGWTTLPVADVEATEFCGIPCLKGRPVTLKASPSEGATVCIPIDRIICVFTFKDLEHFRESAKAGRARLRRRRWWLPW